MAWRGKEKCYFVIGTFKPAFISAMSYKQNFSDVVWLNNFRIGTVRFEFLSYRKQKSLAFGCMILFFFTCISLISCDKVTTHDDFQIEPGFILTRVASEPLIKDPVDLKFNELGDALVLEMPGYPFEDKQSRIVVLKDKDDDAVYDTSIVFIENLQLANSFMLYKKGVLVAAPPYLLFVHDDDQNYQPEKVDTLMGGFSNGNLQHNYNALTLGLDNWI
jgi:hypothetical protein